MAEQIRKGVQYREDEAHASGSVGTMVLAVRKDTATGLAGVDGDYIPLIVDSAGRLWVTAGAITPGTGATDLGKAEDAAHTSGDTGVMTLAVRNENLAALTDTNGDYAPIAVRRTGTVMVTPVEGDIGFSGTSNAPGFAGDLTGTLRALAIAPYLYNGTSMEVSRANLDGTAIPSAARTTTNNSGDLTNRNGRGVVIVLDITAFSATPTVTLTVEGKDTASGKYYAILSGAAISVSGATTTVYVVYPGISETANVDASFPLPRTWRVTVTHGDADSVTYSVGYSLIL